MQLFVLRCFMGDVLACRVDECISEGVPHGVGGAFSIVEHIGEIFQKHIGDTSKES
jgi:hypothetical protein